MLESQALLTLMLISVPTLFALGALGNVGRVRWRLTGILTGLALAAGLAATILSLADAAGGGGSTAPHAWLSQSLLGPVMLTLIGFLGLVVVRYSRAYLAGEPGEARYLGWLQLTLAAVAGVVAGNHLLVLFAAWVGISLALHRLLMFYPERPRAALAAHKRFLFARLGEAALLASFLLLHEIHGTWLISDIVAAYDGEATWGRPSALAAVLLALAALVQCAQLPLHGWLMQVMEAPTPVSALLHAGIVNLGGFLLILFAPLLAQAAAAQWLLLAVAGPSAVLAALVMTTRISIKVRLAWSTCAQMALMLVECALGLFELALLHLLAHSCYKAHAFLNAGSAVERDLRRRAAPAASPGTGDWLVSASLSLALVFGLVVVLGVDGPFSPWLLLAMAMTLLMAQRDSRLQAQRLPVPALLAATLAAGYLLQKSASGLVAPALTASAGWPADAWTALLFLTLFAGHWLLRYRPRCAAVQRGRVYLFAGFYLDEWATRATLAIWPARLPARANPKRLKHLQEEVVS